MTVSRAFKFVVQSLCAVLLLFTSGCTTPPSSSGLGTARQPGTGGRDNIQNGDICIFYNSVGTPDGPLPAIVVNVYSDGTTVDVKAGVPIDRDGGATPPTSLTEFTSVAPMSSAALSTDANGISTFTASDGWFFMRYFGLAPLFTADNAPATPYTGQPIQYFDSDSLTYPLPCMIAQVYDDGVTVDLLCAFPDTGSVTTVSSVSPVSSSNDFGPVLGSNGNLVGLSGTGEFYFDINGDEAAHP